MKVCMSTTTGSHWTMLKLSSDQTMKQQGKGASASVTRGDGKICVVKWYDNKPILMLSTVTYVIVTQPSIVRE